MADDDPTRLARSLVRAYHDVGIPAKLHSGRLFVLREGGWDGPLDPLPLRETYREEIDRIVWLAKRAFSDGFDSLKDRNPHLDPHILLELEVLKREDFLNAGLGDHAATLYESVVRTLLRRGELRA